MFSTEFIIAFRKVMLNLSESQDILSCFYISLVTHRLQVASNTNPGLPSVPNAMKCSYKCYHAHDESVKVWLFQASRDENINLLQLKKMNKEHLINTSEV